ncbi:hypothetical protein F5Y06DRAFT_34799 [Hypoxylon sp. FL0890]|nr:hypothetical protein F5Y06DRAFT_34799 [Hypoxylon sp. FL0890]
MNESEDERDRRRRRRYLVALPTWGDLCKARISNCTKRLVADYMFSRRFSQREAMHPASGCSKTKMAPAVTPERNRVEAAEIFGSPIACVSDEVHLVHLVLRMVWMVRRWPFRHLVRPWKTNTEVQRRVDETLVWFALRDGNDCRCGTIRL